MPFASRWVLPDLGFDLPRLQDEADTFAKATPLSDRILQSYKPHLTYWVEQRMALDGDAATQLARAERMLAERAQLVEAEGFPRVANGLRARERRSAVDRARGADRRISPSVAADLPAPA